MNDELMNSSSMIQQVPSRIQRNLLALGVRVPALVLRHEPPCSIEQELPDMNVSSVFEDGRFWTSILRFYINIDLLRAE
jgi:hypothetical protein